MGSKKNQAYKPRLGTSNKNLKNYRDEQLEYTKKVNEEVFHIFGYADMSNEEEYDGEPNNTPFMDFKGKAKPENRAKFNYFKTLNEMGMKKRMNLAHGELPPEKDKIVIDKTHDDAQSCISKLDLFSLDPIFEHLTFINGEE